MNQQSGNTDSRSGAVGAALYYGITALVVVGIAIAVIAGKYFYRRKAQKEIRRRNDLERQDALRRGEAGGLPTYHEYPNTIPLNVPTLAYPDAARRANGDSAPSSQAMQDPSLPSYDASAPPKYEYATNAAAATGGAIQRAASSIRQALSRPASLRRNDSSATTTPTQQQLRSTTGEPEMQEMTSTNTPSTRVMTSAPVMHIAPMTQSRNQSTTSVNTMRTARSSRSSNSEHAPQPEERMENVPLDDERR